MAKVMTVERLIRILQKWDSASEIDICVTDRIVTRRNLLSVKGVEARITGVDLCFENPDGPDYIMITGIITRNEFAED